MAIVENLSDEEGGSEAGPSGFASRLTGNLVSELERLSAELALPAELVPEFMAVPDDKGTDHYTLQAERALEQVGQLVQQPGWDEVRPEEQLRLLENALRLNGREPWSSASIRSHVSGIMPRLSPSVPLLVLPTLRQYFTPHPSLSATSRALSRPTGGRDATIDLHDSQPFKLPSAWGIVNLLRYAVEHLSHVEVEKNIGLIVPPTLVLMDDFEPSFRHQGAIIMDAWQGKLDPDVMRRMGLDKLFLNSLIHTLSLHSNPPPEGVLDITLRFVTRCIPEGEKRTAVYVDIMEKAVVQGWLYAPSGVEGRPVLIHVAQMLERMCDAMGTGVTRWLKTIIPQLLQPLQYIPTLPVLPHYIVNLSCLLKVLRTLAGTGRIERWRGQILNILCRLWVQMKERTVLGEQTSQVMEAQIRRLVQDVLCELVRQAPAIQHNELKRLTELSPSLFSDLIEPVQT
ncbi:hypothetical protein IAU60_000744 [Kwoniella sp. DSM 27419]